MPPRERHPTIFNTWNALPAGSALLLVNDHDPLPLYYQFACEHGGTFRWEYVEQGPAVWRVRIAKGDYPDPGFRPQSRMAKPVVAPVTMAEPVVLDVRPIFERNETPCEAIDAAAAQVIPGQSLILLVPFEPVPLYAKLQRLGFSPHPEQLEDGTWRIEFRRTEAAPAMGSPAVSCCGGH